MLLKIINENSNLLKVLSKTLLSRMVSALGAILFSFVIARFAGASELGAYATLTTVTFVLAIVGRFGLDSVFLVHGSIAISRGDIKGYFLIKKKLFRAMMLGSLMIGVALAIKADYISILLFGEENRNRELGYLAALVVLYNVMYFQSACLKCIRKPEISPLIEMGAMSFVACFFILLLDQFNNKITVSLCLASTVLSALVVGLIGKITTSRYEKLICGKENDSFKFAVWGYVKEGWDHMTGNLIAFIAQWSSLLILAYYVTTEEVGIFSMVQRLAMLTTFMLSIFNTIAANNFVILSRRPDKNELQSYVRKTTNIMFFIGVGVTSFVALFSRNILELFGNEFVVGWIFLIVLNFGQLINVATGSVGTLLNMSGNQKSMKYVIVVTSVLSTVISFWLIPKIGIWGAVIATFCNLVLQNVAASCIAYKCLNIKTYPH